MRALRFSSIDLSNYHHLDWQTQLASLVTDTQTLFSLLDIDPKTVQAWQAHQPQHFPLRVPHAFVAKMAKGDLNDPLLRQVLPVIDETHAITGYSADPLHEASFNTHKGMLHKYRSRVLVTLTGACALHCRYCFRQHFDYQTNLPNNDDTHAILDYIQAHPEITEVLLSGGDPLNVSNRRLITWLSALDAVPHLKSIRLHTRLPVVLPARIDTALLAGLGALKKRVVMVIHTNHPNELDAATIHACHALKTAGVTLLNQSVLLKGINDDLDTLSRLSHALFDAGVLPYYLHLLDKVAGAAHFDVAMADAVALYWQLLANLSGYLVPKLVQELPHRPYKTPVDIHAFSPTHAQKI